MITKPIPAKAEIIDIHSAVIDGTDCLCLNEETSAGKYPIESLQMMSDICITAEKQFDYK